MLQVLSADERAQLHERTLHVLATAGMRVDTAQGRRILKDAGARVDEATRVVRFPPALVEESLRLAPKQFSLGARRPGWSMPMNAGESTLVMDGEATSVLDHVTGEHRPGTHADWLETTRLIDAVDEVGVYWAMIDGCMPGDTMTDWIDYNTDLMRTFSKHVQDSFSNPEWAPWVLEVLQIVFGNRERVRRQHPYSFLITPVSPLIIEQACTDTWLALRGWDIPVTVLPMPMMGATAPGSLLGTTLLANCETLGVLCLVQAAEPGTPFIYAPIAVTMDPRTGRYAGGTAHAAIGVAGMEMARHYGLPVMGSGSGTDAFVPGAQAGYEKAFDSLLGTLAWPDLMVGPGCLAGASPQSRAAARGRRNLPHVPQGARGHHGGGPPLADRRAREARARWPLPLRAVDARQQPQRRVVPAGAGRARLLRRLDGGRPAHGVRRGPPAGRRAARHARAAAARRRRGARAREAAPEGGEDPVSGAAQ